MSDFFELLEQHYASQLPFVIYHKPYAANIVMHMLPTAELCQIENFEASGFVFAPFNLKEKAVLFPQKSLETKEVKVADISLDGLTFEAKSIDEDDTAKEAYLDLLHKTIQEIRIDQALDKIVTSRQINFKKENLKASLLFKKMLKAYPNAMAYIWYHPQVGFWAGATPETLIKFKRNQLQTMALAGTRHKNVMAENPFTEKEKKEQAFVTEQILEALEKTKAKSISTSELKTAEAGDLIHLLTEISAQIQLE
ncbi:MAG: chorismate-binding protein, partial [Lactococcus lactis]|nr:chorismate-binding protein [Lactococcus lactis]